MDIYDAFPGCSGWKQIEEETEASEHFKVVEMYGISNLDLQLQVYKTTWSVYWRATCLPVFIDERLDATTLPMAKIEASILLRRRVQSMVCATHVIGEVTEAELIAGRENGGSSP